ncbi:metacaspase 2, putative [Plasmodium malariae]|uniref:Metacaspase 2, putative n=1 Tax=Plasmodium malariae TaxID=5858 RepID=A0A1C3L1W2_PLAMA|nr:metacaspase 2, putative [Plasmodium malariae]
MSSKNLFFNDKHKYHEKVITNVYQFTGGASHKQCNLKNNSKMENSIKVENKITCNVKSNNKGVHDLNGQNIKLDSPSQKKNVQNVHVPAMSENKGINLNKGCNTKYNGLIEHDHTNNTSNKDNFNDENALKNQKKLKDMRESEKIDNEYLNTMNNPTPKQNTFQCDSNLHKKQLTYKNSINILNDSDKNNIKQNVYNYSTIIQNNFINNSEKMSKILLNTKRDNRVQNRNEANLAFINVNKYINNIFKTNNNSVDSTKEDIFINNYEKIDIHNDNSNNDIDKKLNTNGNIQNRNNIYKPHLCSVSVYHSNVPEVQTDDILINDAKRLHVLEKEHGVLNSPTNIYLHSSVNGMNENTKSLMKHCTLNKFLYEKKQKLKSHIEPLEQKYGTHELLYANKECDSTIINKCTNNNPIIKLITKNNMKDVHTEYKDSMLKLNSLCNISKYEGVNEGVEEQMKEGMLYNNKTSNNGKSFSFGNLLKNELKNNPYNMDNLNINQNGYMQSVISVADKDNLLNVKRNFQDIPVCNNNENNVFLNNINENIILNNNFMNNSKFQNGNIISGNKEIDKIRKNKIENKKDMCINSYNNDKKEERLQKVHYDVDEILLLKSQVSKELNTCLKCLNNLTKNKELFEQLKKYKRKLAEKEDLEHMGDIEDIEDVSEKSYSDKAESYYTMKNSYISSMQCNENKTADILYNKDDNTIPTENFFSKNTSNIVHMIHQADVDGCKNIIYPSEYNNDYCSDSRNTNMVQKDYVYFEENVKAHRKKKDSVHFNLYDNKNMYHTGTNTNYGKNKKENEHKINMQGKCSSNEAESPYIGKKKALVVTLIYNGLLEGCKNDTIHMCDHLMGTFKFNELTLLNDCNLCYRNFVTRKANKRNIINNLYDFITKSNNGDILFFYFCGYSIKIIDSKFSENHNFALLPQDYSKNKYIYSNEIYNIIKKLEGGKQLCIVFDTTYTSYFVPTSTSITYNKNINTTEISKSNYLQPTNKKYKYSLRTFGKVRDRHVEPVYLENVKRPSIHELYKPEEGSKRVKNTLVPSIFFFSPDTRDRNDFEFLIKNNVRGLLTYCVGKAIELLKRDFSYHDLFVVASKLLVNIKKEYKIKYIKFKLSFLNEHSPDDIKFLSHESLFLNKKMKLEEPLWKPSLRLNNLNEYMKDIYNFKEKNIQKNFVKRCLLIFIKDIKFYTSMKIDLSVEYFVSCFIKTKNINILYVRRNNTKMQKIVRDKIFFLEYVILNLSDVVGLK